MKKAIFPILVLACLTATLLSIVVSVNQHKSEIVELETEIEVLQEKIQEMRYELDRKNDDIFHLRRIARQGQELIEEQARDIRELTEVYIGMNNQE